jgi:hypothetical protein
MNVTLTPTHLAVELTLFEKVASLHGDISIPRERIRTASVDLTPMASIRRGVKIGLRIPGRRYVCTTRGRKHFWALERGAPALHVETDGASPRALTVTTPDAAELAAELA